jgi:hypothetical protein
VSDDPVAEYKEILDVTRRAAQQLAERERRRSLEVLTEILTADKAIKSTTEAETELKKQIAEWWRKVAAKLFDLNWLPAGRPPEPDPAGRPERLDDYVGEIEPATNTLYTAIRRASWPRKPS